MSKTCEAFVDASGESLFNFYIFIVCRIYQFSVMSESDFGATLFRGPAQFDIEDYLDKDSLMSLKAVTPADCAVAPPSHLHLSSAIVKGGVLSMTDRGVLSVPLTDEDMQKVLKQKQLIYKKCKSVCQGNKDLCATLMAAIYRKLKPMRDTQRLMANLNRQGSQIRRQIKEITDHWAESEWKRQKLETLNNKMKELVHTKSMISKPNPNHIRMHSTAIKEVFDEYGISDAPLEELSASVEHTAESDDDESDLSSMSDEDD